MNCTVALADAAELNSLLRNSPPQFKRLRNAESIGRPLGNRKFLDRLERKTRRVLRPAKRGPKPRVGLEDKCTGEIREQGAVPVYGAWLTRESFIQGCGRLVFVDRGKP